MAVDSLKCGLSEEDLQQIKGFLRLFPHIEEAVLFGSRAKGTYKQGSDIDLCIKGERVTRDDISYLAVLFDASMLPYFVDLVCYSKIRNGALREHIERVGISIYKSSDVGLL